MLTDRNDVETNWTSLCGTVLQGGYQLEELLEADENMARYRVRVLGDGSIDAVGLFYRASGLAGAEQVATWQSVRELGSANLNAPLSAGSTQLGTIELIYVVSRRPDEALKAVIRERALGAEEAVELLSSITRALSDLHTHGFVHG